MPESEWADYIFSCIESQHFLKFGKVPLWMTKKMQVPWGIGNQWSEGATWDNLKLKAAPDKSLIFSETKQPKISLGGNI